MSEYNHRKIEKKWQKIWEKSKIYKTKEIKGKQKYYALDMFPYPSGEGLHVGHPRGYIATDVYSRYQRMKGFNVLHPMGWDAFGLPAENYAIKHKIHPKIAVNKNIATYKRQLKAIGFDYDWSREINTTDPNYYKWTQWIFLQFFKKGLACQSYEPINWCPSCKTGLALEDLDGNLCERCGTEVKKKSMRQWVLKITAYAEKLLDDLKLLDWPNSIIEQQKNWIGRSEGATIDFQITNYQLPITVFTTRLDTIFGCTYLVIAPEHPLLGNSEKGLGKSIKNYEEVKNYIEQAKKKSDLQRTMLAEAPTLAEGKVGGPTANRVGQKTGIELKGIKAINPFSAKGESASGGGSASGGNNEEVPVFVADYVLSSYGTGAVMAVPAHDERDWEFAKKYNLPIKEAIKPTTNDKRPTTFLPFIEDGVLVNSGEFSGLKSSEAREKMSEWLKKNKAGDKTIKYRLQDWVFSRQRYWGEPIPIIYCRKCWEISNLKSQISKLSINYDYIIIDGLEHEIVPVPEKDLPVKLPSVKFYEPTGTGESPLANIAKWVNVKCPKCNGPAKRETNTMPQWAGSCWYYLAYIAKRNFKFEILNFKLLKKWLPVDFYVGGAEHATRHLIYARFWHKFLYDIGVVPTKEPFHKLANQGLILAEDGRKMSKRWGNVISPDEIIKNYGADTLRVYEMFMGPFEQAINWSTDSMVGSRRFLERVWRLCSDANIRIHTNDTNKIERLIHQTIKKVTEDIENFKFNTAISALMILLNEMEHANSAPSPKGFGNANAPMRIEYFEIFLKLLSPFAPHLSEELWQNIKGKSEKGKVKNITSAHLEKWPKYDKRLIKEEFIKMPVQINGKVRAEIEIEADWEEEKVKETALENEVVKKWISGKEIKKVIYVENKIINIVI